MRSSGNPSRPIALLFMALALAAWAPADTPISDAVRRGDADAVRTLLRDGADVNASAGDGMTALHWAADAGEVEIANILIDAGANVDAVTRLGDYTPLHLASRQGSASLIEALLEAGASPNSNSTAGGSSALHFAAGAGSVEAVTTLLEHGAEVNGRESSRGQTPLMFAAAKGRADAIRALLANGADPSLASLIVSLPERLAEDRAAGQRRRAVLADFRAEAAPRAGEAWRPTPSQVEVAVHAATQPPPDGSVAAVVEDPMAEAYRRGFAPEPPEDSQQQVIIEEVSSLSFVELVGTTGGTTALIYAVREGHAEAAFALLDGGADIDQMNSGDRTSALSSATINGHFDLALKLLERGADPNLVNDGGVGPLFAALNVEWAPKARYPQQQAYRQQQATHTDVMSALLEAGADPNQRLTRHVWFMEYTFTHLGINMAGATPFWRAAHALDLEAMKILVAAGADTNIPTINVPRGRRGFGRGGFGGGGGGGGDPSGLDPVPAGGPGVFPVHAASGHGYGIGYAGNSHRHVPDAWLPSLKYLVEELGADVDTRDANAHTPLHNAAARGDTEMIQYLVDRGADVMVVNRRGLTTVDMANGPSQRTQPYPEAIELLESLGAKNSHRCTSCQ